MRGWTLPTDARNRLEHVPEQCTRGAFLFLMLQWGGTCSVLCQALANARTITRAPCMGAPNPHHNAQSGNVGHSYLCFAGSVLESHFSERAGDAMGVGVDAAPSMASGDSPRRGAGRADRGRAGVGFAGVCRVRALRVAAGPGDSARRPWAFAGSWCGRVSGGLLFEARRMPTARPSDRADLDGADTQSTGDRYTARVYRVGQRIGQRLEAA